jgi:AsmA protein
MDSCRALDAYAQCNAAASALGYRPHGDIIDTYIRRFGRHREHHRRPRVSAAKEQTGSTMTYRRPPGAPPPPFEGYHFPDEHGTPPSRQPRRQASQSSSPVLLGLVYGGIGLLALAVVAVTFVVMAPPTDLIRREIVAQVKAATGRDLTIGGGASFTVFPSLGVHAGDVSLSAPADMGGEPLFTAASIDVGVRLLPLLRQEIVVDRLVLHEPVFALRVDDQGRKSWNMAANAPARRVRLAQAGGGTTLRDFSSGVDLAGDVQAAAGPSEKKLEQTNLSFGAIRIDNGTVHYANARSGADVKVAAINAEAGLEAAAGPLKAKGNLAWANETIDFDGTLTSLADLLGEQPAKLAVSLKGAPFSLSYDGSVTLRDVLTAEGALDGSASSLRALATWLGSELPPVRGFRDASLAGYLNATASAVRLSDARIGLDGATATGTIALTTSGAKPHVSADLKVANLDLGNYLGGRAEAGAPAPARPAAIAPPATDSAEPPQSIEDLLDQPASPDSQGSQGPQVRGFTQRAGWSGEPFDLVALGAVDADAKLAVTALSYGDVHVDAAQLTVGLKDSVLKTTFEEIKLYEGHGKGFVTLDGSGSDAAVDANIQLKGIAARPLLKDAADIDWLAGTGDVALAISGRGASETALVQSLSGKSDVAVNNGAIIGFNLSGAIRGLADGNIPDFDSSPTDKTDFSALTGSFVITDGIAKNDDLQLASPLLRATGGGTVDLPARSLDYVVKPKVVATLSGQGGDKDLHGIEIPLHVTGSWEDPKIKADIAGAINNPETVEAVKELGKELKGKNAGEIVEGLFGKSEDGKPSKAEKLLQKFLGR